MKKIIYLSVLLSAFSVSALNVNDNVVNVMNGGHKWITIEKIDNKSYSIVASPSNGKVKCDIRMSNNNRTYPVVSHFISLDKFKKDKVKSCLSDEMKSKANVEAKKLDLMFIE